METAAAEFKTAWSLYEAAQRRADDAFMTYFRARERGDRTNGAAWRRLLAIRAAIGDVIARSGRS